MKVCVAHVYWMLLFTSVVSSALLFLIVASESIQNSKFIGPDRNQVVAQEENVSFIEDSKHQFESDSQTKPNIKVSSSLKNKIIQESTLQNTQTPLSASFDVSNKNEESKIPEEIEILKESLTQQPNLSQGISDGGQAVVLTLVDTTAGLQSLASGRADFLSKSASGAEAISNVSTAEDSEDDELVRIPQLELEASNGTDLANNETDETEYNEGSADVVVVVRAEQRSTAAIGDQLAEEDRKEAESDEEPEHEEVGVTQEPPQLPKNPTTAPDLNDSAARARLTGSADDSSAVILDSFVTQGPSDPHEEIPSFNEWAQKRLEEAEKKKTHPNVSVQTANGSPGRGVGNMRMRSKNYASPDCGAKIVAANPEARSARSVLVSTRDEYMLNTCTSRVWFVVELCEAIQAKKIELANFELFSSSPKDLSVYVSDRFPTRDWMLAGQFTARDERDVQSFSLQPHLFGKFIKVELHSHYGSEHFCPISLFRAYGTSEFEVLETETDTDSHSDSRRREISAGGDVVAGSDVENEDEDDEDSVFEEEEESTSEPPGNLFGSARDAVLSIVKKAAEVLVKSDDLKSTNNITKIQESIRGDVLEDETLDDCTTPLYNVACRDCNDDRFARVFQLISCKEHYLESLLNTGFVQETLAKSHLCGSSSGFDFLYDKEACTDGSKAVADRNNDASNYYLQAQLLSSLFTPDYIIALCNVLAAREQRLFVNASHQEQQQATSDGIPNKTRVEQQGNQVPLASTTKVERVTSTRGADIVSPTTDSHKTKADAPVIKSKLELPDSPTLSESLITQIKPTKLSTLNEDAKKQSMATNLESSRSHQTEDGNVHKVEGSMTTESSVPVVTKRTTSPSSSSQDHTQVPINSQESSSQRDVPSATKVTHSGSQQKPSEKASVDSSGETEAKSEEESEAKTKAESAEQEAKVTTQGQDQLNFEGFDFKDLEVESLQANGAAKSDASVTQQTASNTGTPQQKESVFLRLSNRIKALERNMSLSSQYLEELSRRYKKQVEEMQRSLERAVTTMNEESRKGEERESKRIEEVTALRGQIDTLTKVLDDLVYERNSWRINFSTLLQHGIFVLVDVVIVILILSYCRRADDDLDYYEDENDEKSIVVRPKRGKNYEIVKQTCIQLTKKTKKRRPSEIASQVSGTYDQLMIEDAMVTSQLSKKDRRKKRRKEIGILRTSSIKDNVKGDGSLHDAKTKLPSRSASASDALYSLNPNNGSNSLINLGSQRQSRPESAPDNSIIYFSEREQSQPTQYDKRVQILAMEQSHEGSTKSDDEAGTNPDGLNVSVSLEDDAFEQLDSSPSSFRNKVKKLSPSAFMRTALGSRSKRISFNGGSNKKLSQSLDESMIKPLERRYDGKMGSLSEFEVSNGAGDEYNNGQASNGHVEESDESRSSSATPTPSWNKKEKKTNGLKKMVRKFF
ncbi:hypothetical protein TSAR_005717 [Trichomalopsis sarcophagae]|uniref:SUN domain-containing protein n=1 Tax=Trichomalopsis sarcophagae TaxID=543379 RepID=A0A232F929_9HYME|nr:hypothetical protein TSAR_005717 [Trichomalopsis sarcophagae]